MRAVQDGRGDLLLLPARDATPQSPGIAVQADSSPVDAPDSGNDLPAVLARERRHAVRSAALADALPIGVGGGELLHPQALGALATRSALRTAEALALSLLVALLDDLPGATRRAEREPDARHAFACEIRKKNLDDDGGLSVHVSGIELFARQQAEHSVPSRRCDDPLCRVDDGLFQRGHALVGQRRRDAQPESPVRLRGAAWDRHGFGRWMRAGTVRRSPMSSILPLVPVASTDRTAA